MKRGDRFPNDQAEIVFCDLFIEFLEALPTADQEEVLIEILGLCSIPAGNHPLSSRSGKDDLAGWNTLEVLNRRYRVIFKSRVQDGVGTIAVLLAGPRKGDAVYDMAGALTRSGRLSSEEGTDLWTALALLDVVAENVGLDGWDYRPEPAPIGMVKTVVAASLMEDSIAKALSLDELQAAQREGWGEDGPDPAAALGAALKRARSGIHVNDATYILKHRLIERCDVLLPRAGARCIRKVGHPGAHRASS